MNQVWGRVVSKVLFAGISLIALALGQTALAADLPAAPVYKAPPPVVWTPSWFVEGRVGGSWGRFDDFRFLNPIGAAGLGVPGPYIPLNSVSSTSSSWTAGVAAGYFFTNTLFAKVSYDYLGRFRARGFADFTAAGIGNVSQDLKTAASVLLFGLGADFNLTPAVFVEVTGQIGAAFLNSSGVQSANLGTPTNFPSAHNTNFAGAVGAGIGFHATRTVDLMLNGTYYWLGKADTGITGN